MREANIEQAMEKPNELLADVEEWVKKAWKK